MSGSKVEEKALRLLTAFENAGKSVSRVAIEGRKIEIVLSKERKRLVWLPCLRPQMSDSVHDR